MSGWFMLLQIPFTAIFTFMLVISMINPMVDFFMTLQFGITDITVWVVGTSCFVRSWGLISIAGLEVGCWIGTSCFVRSWGLICVAGCGFGCYYLILTSFFVQREEEFLFWVVSVFDDLIIFFSSRYIDIITKSLIMCIMQSLKSDSWWVIKDTSTCILEAIVKYLFFPVRCTIRNGFGGVLFSPCVWFLVFILSSLNLRQVRMVWELPIGEGQYEQGELPGLED